MKTPSKLLIASTTAALLGGCASGGGGDGASPGAQSFDPALAPLRPGLEPSPCGTLYGYPVPCRPLRPEPTSDSSQSGPWCYYGTYCPESYTGPRASNSTSASDSLSLSAGASAPGSNFVPAALPPFVSWSELAPRGTAKFASISWGRSYQQPILSASITSTANWGPEGFLSPRYDESHALASVWQPSSTGDDLFASATQGALRNLASIGEPAIDFGSTPLKPFFGLQVSNPFTSIPSTDAIALMANPYGHGWDYQSFGVWNNHGGGNREIAVSSFGAQTPASAIPTVGTATFTGKLAGLYVGTDLQGAMATANLTVAADFGSRSLSFASSGTTTTRDLAIATPAPNLDLRGTLTYAPGSSHFRGAVTSAGGTMSGDSGGLFFGPAAQELGGAFTVRSSTTVETFTGAYGAKR